MAFLAFNTHYTSLFTTISACLCGIAFAIGHHFFYQHLNGHQVLDSSWQVSSYRVTSQQINVSVGTLFAFLVKALLGVSVSTVFDQMSWKAIKEHTTRIGVIDDLFSVLSNGFFILNPQLWRHYPLAMILASIFWLLPVASVITPATLNVQMSPYQTSRMVEEIPRVDFTSANFAGYDSVEKFNLQTNYRGPSYPVEKVISATTAQGRMMAITPPSINSSWVLDFHGPALSCQTVDPPIHDSIMDNIESAVNQTFTTIGHNSAMDAWGYLSWTPGTDNNGTLPFAQNETSGEYSFRQGSLGPKIEPSFKNSTAANSNTPLSLFVATFPKMQTATEFAASDSVSPDEWKSALKDALQNETIIHCTLYNASYTTHFDYTNGDQNVTISRLTHLNDVGYLRGLGGENSFPYETLTPKDYNGTLVENFAYQSVMDAFGDIVVGSIATTILPLDPTPKINTKIMQTSLSETRELAFVTNVMNSTASILNNMWDQHSIIPSVDPTVSLAESIEQLFQNITLSLMSSHQLQPNFSSPLAPPPINVTTTKYQNVYVYSQSILWLAYGIAIGVTTLTTLLGVYAYHVNHGSYSSQFSTIVRVTRDALLSEELLSQHTDGKDPLPDYIGKMRITFPNVSRVKASPPSAPSPPRPTETATAPSPPPFLTLTRTPTPQPPAHAQGKVLDGQREPLLETTADR